MFKTENKQTTFSFCKCLGCNSKLYLNNPVLRLTEFGVKVDCPFCNVELRLKDLKIETEIIEQKEEKMIGKIVTNQENVELFKIAFGLDRNNKELDKELFAALTGKIFKNCKENDDQKIGIVFTDESFLKTFVTNPVKSSEEIKKENSEKKKKALQELKNLFDYVEKFNSTTNYTKHFKDEISDKIFTEILTLEEEIAANK